MGLIESLSAAEITSIDFDLTIDRDCYAQTTIMHASPRCKAYYCFKNDDTREDGEDRCSAEAFANICTTIADLLKNSNADTTPRLKYELTITTADKHKHTFKPQTGATQPQTQGCSASGTSQECNNLGTAQGCNTFGSELSTGTLKSIIDLLSDHIPEFAFLPAFRPHL